jgi:hypothetical protein
MDFLNHRKGGMVFYQVFLLHLYRNCKRLRDFEEIEIAGKAVEVTVNNKEENSYDFCLDFIQEFGLQCFRPHCIWKHRLRHASSKGRLVQGTPLLRNA